LMLERAGATAERSGAAFLELARRLTEFEKNWVQFGARLETIEKSSTAALDYYKKLFG
jgi:hypothetical protein